jgi:transposase
MSERELQRVEVLSRVMDGTTCVTMAAAVLGLSARKLQRLLQRFRTEGAAAIRHKARGRQSNNRVRDGVRDDALALIRESYADFGPTLAAEKLAERHGLVVYRETVHTWKIAWSRSCASPASRASSRRTRSCRASSRP